MRIIETLSEYQMVKEQAGFSLFLFGSESCAPCKALKQKIMLWSSSHAQVLTNYVSIDNNISLAAQKNIFGAPAILVFVLVVNTYVTLREVFRYNLVWALEIKNCFCCLIIPSLML